MNPAILNPPASPADLLASCWRWVQKLSYKYGRKYGIDPDDLAGEVAVRILKCGETYDPTRGAVTTWAAAVTWSVAARLASQESRARRRIANGLIPLDELADGKDVNDGPADREAAARARVEVDYLLDLIPRPADREIMIARYGLDGNGSRTLAEIGATLGVTKSRAGQRVKAAFDAIRRPRTVAESRPVEELPHRSAIDDVLAILETTDRWLMPGHIVLALRERGRPRAKITVRELLDRLADNDTVRKSHKGYRLTESVRADANRITLAEYRRRLNAARHGTAAA